GVVADLEAANGDLVLPAGRRVGDLIVAEDLIFGETFDLELPFECPLPANVDLLFAKHAPNPLAGDGLVNTLSYQEVLLGSEASLPPAQTRLRCLRGEKM